MNAYAVRARRWEHGWELHVDGVGVTQSASLAGAEKTVRDYLATWFDVDEWVGGITITPELDGLEDDARRSAELTEEAARAQRQAATKARAVARSLRGAGLSVTDAAFVMGVSKGRVSQLTRT